MGLKVVKFGGSSLADANQFRKVVSNKPKVKKSADTLFLQLPEKDSLRISR